MKFGIKSVLLLVVVVSAFCAGWIIPSPMRDKRLRPVVVANREIESQYRIRPDDVRQVFVHESMIPDYVANEVSQVSNHSSRVRIRADGFVYVDELEGPNVLRTFHPPSGYKVVAIKLPSGFNPLAVHLLNDRDVVSLHGGNSMEKDRCLLSRCSIFLVEQFKGRTVVGIWVTDAEADQISDWNKRLFSFSLCVPE